MHKMMQTVGTDVRGVCLPVCRSRGGRIVQSLSNHFGLLLIGVIRYRGVSLAIPMRILSLSLAFFDFYNLLLSSGDTFNLLTCAEEAVIVKVDF